MQNLAGRQDSDVIITRELLRCGITPKPTELYGEVKSTVKGVLQFNGAEVEFTRLWYYYSVSGRFPEDLANQLYADVVGKTDIRVAGHCGCPSPQEFGVWFVGDRQVVSTKEREFFIRHPEMCPDYEQRYIFCDDPKEVNASLVVDSYHIDSELGLYIFACALKNYKG